MFGNLKQKGIFAQIAQLCANYKYNYMEKSFLAFIEDSIKKNWDLDALTDYKGATLQYKDVARKIEKLHILLEESGIKPGDKVALCGRNSSHWGVAFLAILTYGAVAVPILHEFKADNVHNIVNHSDARLLFVGDVVWEALNEAEMPNLEGIILMTDFTLLVCRSKQLEYAREHLNEMFGKKFPRNFRKEHVSYRRDTPEELALINYTSGTTSFSKGVMLPYRSLWSNTQFAFEVLTLQPGNKVISILPMAHMYGLAFEFIYEFCAGCHVYFLTRMPSPKIIFQAFSEVKPHIVISVPLIIEKIIKKNVLPKLETLKMKLLLKVPLINDKIKEAVREHMVQAFGGNFYEVIIGGAAFNQDVERLLRSLDFPYTVGYGMTECGPIICYEDWLRYKPGSCGKAAPRMEIKIDSPDPQNIVGEILTRGEIEEKISNLPYVCENIVIQQSDHKLAALIYPDFEEAYKQGLTDADIERIMEENRVAVNAELPVYSQITRIKIYPEEFEKTPKKSIKRFLYQEVK